MAGRRTRRAAIVPGAAVGSGAGESPAAALSAAAAAVERAAASSAAAFKRHGPASSARAQTSAYRGVGFRHDHRRGKPWRARIIHTGRRKELGCFTEEGDAARAYDARARQLHGASAQLNFPAAKKKGKRLELIRREVAELLRTSAAEGGMALTAKKTGEMLELVRLQVVGLAIVDEELSVRLHMLLHLQTWDIALHVPYQIALLGVLLVIHVGSGWQILNHATWLIELVGVQWRDEVDVVAVDHVFHLVAIALVLEFAPLPDIGQSKIPGRQ
jgi:hypothetical protein